MHNRLTEALTHSRSTMPEADLVWSPTILDDPEGGRIILWPHLPCVRMSNELRTREHWDGVAFIASSDELEIWIEEEKQDLESPGVHVAAAMASGTTLGRLLDDLKTLDVDGPSIPEPEPLRLLHHAKNARGGLPIFALEPTTEDEMWMEWLTCAADAQVTLSSLIAGISVGRRWKKQRSAAIERVAQSRYVDVELGAAAASSAAWWMEECRGLDEALIAQRATRIVARMRGALAELREGRVDDSDSRGPSLLVPVHQPRLPALAAAFEGWPDVESIVAVTIKE
ncbi:MAG TPA: hypothetical protein QF529_00645 [Candidatus Thalassarchaeaceae archaeon]|nr:hypothetical protein [Candidatus Thalassarchaeaceae archaeon]|tara:strand:- start:8219 stop:9070 length:852 start_codon:yes stop_codon:yes gene_type:complete